MTPELKAIKILCPTCRTSLAGLGLLPGMKRLCPYCGTSFVSGAENMEEAMVGMPDRVIPFTTDRKDFEREVLKCLARNESTPLAIFDSISFLDAEGIYLPLYLYEGSYTFSRDDAQAVPAQPARRNIFGMKNHREPSPEKYPFAILCPAGSAPEMLEQMTARIAARKEECGDSRLYSSQLLDMTMFIPAASGSMEVWEECGSEALEKQVINPHRDEAEPEPKITVSDKVGAKLVMMPFWLATFSHCGHTYRFIMDGTDASSITEFLPGVLSEPESVKQLRVLSDYLLVTAWLSLVLLFWNIWLPPAIIWAAWLAVFIIIRIRRAVSRNKDKKADL